MDLKRLSDRETNDSDKEVEILSLLDHANIITYYNHYVDSGLLLIEMEYANGTCFLIAARRSLLVILIHMELKSRLKLSTQVSL